MKSFDRAASSVSSTEIAGPSLKSTESEPSLRYAWYVVFILMVCYALSFVDRQILSLLVGPMKRDLALSDTRIGLLQGLAFALFYGLMGLPLGRLADTRNRRNVIILGVVLWSFLTGACSAATSFWSLFLARMGVGVGSLSPDTQFGRPSPGPVTAGTLKRLRVSERTNDRAVARYYNQRSVRFDAVHVSRGLSPIQDRLRTHAWRAFERIKSFWGFSTERLSIRALALTERIGAAP
jgi:hypothetical protein